MLGRVVYGRLPSEETLPPPYYRESAHQPTSPSMLVRMFGYPYSHFCCFSVRSALVVVAALGLLYGAVVTAALLWLAWFANFSPKELNADIQDKISWFGDLLSDDFDDDDAAAFLGDAATAIEQFGKSWLLWLLVAYSALVIIFSCVGFIAGKSYNLNCAKYFYYWQAAHIPFSVFGYTFVGGLLAFIRYFVIAKLAWSFYTKIEVFIFLCV